MTEEESYQFAVCAKDLAEPLSHLQAVVECNGHEMGRTEILIEATSDPVWKTLVVYQNDTDVSLTDMHLHVDIRQVNDEDSSPKLVASATFAGDALAEAYYKAVARYTDAHGDGGAKICLYADQQQLGTLALQLGAFDLPDLDFGMFWQKNNLSDPFVEIHGSSSTAPGTVVHRTEVIWDNLNPLWETCELDLDVLSGGRLDTPIRLAVYDQDSGTKKQYMGQVSLSVHDMLQSIVTEPPPEQAPTRTKILASLRGSRSKTNGSTVEIPPNYHRLAKGGIPCVKGSLYVKAAALLPQTYVTREMRRKCNIVLSSLDARYDKLAQQAAEAAQEVERAQLVFDEANAHVTEFDEAAHIAAWQQTEAHAHLQECKQELLRLQAAADKAPIGGDLQLVLRAQNLPDLDFGFRNKSDPMYEILPTGSSDNSSVNGGSSLCSNIVQNNLNPTWELQTLPLRAVGGLEKSLSILFWDINKNDLNDKQLMGSIHDMTVEKLMAAASDKTELTLGSPARKAKIWVVRADLENRVDNTAALQKYRVRHFQPAAEACRKTTEMFEAVRQKAEAAHQKAAHANQALEAAKDKAMTVQKALETIQNGRN